MRTGAERTVEVKPSYGLSDDDVERMLEESIDCAEEDVRQRQIREARVDADTILHVTAGQLDRYGHLLTPGEGSAIQAAVRRLEEARAGEDYLQMRDAYDALSQATEPFATRIMDTALQDVVVSRPLEEL
jgi:molecular chaperone DnaK (HSP70)